MAMAMQKIRALGGRRQWRAGAACRQIQARTPRKSATKLHMETDCRKILIRHENPSPLERANVQEPKKIVEKVNGYPEEKYFRTAPPADGWGGSRWRGKQGSGGGGSFLSTNG
uniref:Uncharacterized protein n=1 Tax=Oryza glumipatula TaxID=40148 RepID=A0A0E0BME3_9ORYZ